MINESNKSNLESIMKEIIGKLDGLTIEESKNVLLNVEKALTATGVVQANRVEAVTYEISLRAPRFG